MGLTAFTYEMEDGTTGQVNARPADVAAVERATGDFLTRGMSYEHCMRIIHRVLTREAKRDGSDPVPPYEAWSDGLMDLAPVDSEKEPGDIPLDPDSSSHGTT